jgi:hypothetical protein
VIASGPRLLVDPGRYWSRSVGADHRSAGWLVAAALTAAVLPAAAVVASHLGAAALGHIARDVAVQRAAVGLVAAAGGALVLAPALTLVLMWLTRASRVEAGGGRETGAAMGIVWPVWTAGLVLALPPLVDFGPEPGEILWVLLGTAVALRTIRKGVVPHLGVRRRWRTHFTLRLAAAFVVLFVAVPVAPAFVARGLLGVSGETVRSAPVAFDLPLPPDPDW